MARRFKSAKDVYIRGDMDDITEDFFVEIVKNLYLKRLAEAFFIGMGWPEGYRYAYEEAYVRLTMYPAFLNKSGNESGSYRRAFWFACRFLEGD